MCIYRTMTIRDYLNPTAMITDTDTCVKALMKTLHHLKRYEDNNCSTHRQLSHDYLMTYSLPLHPKSLTSTKCS